MLHTNINTSNWNHSNLDKLKCQNKLVSCGLCLVILLTVYCFHESNDTRQINWIVFFSHELRKAEESRRVHQRQFSVYQTLFVHTSFTLFRPWNSCASVSNNISRIKLPIHFIRYNKILICIMQITRLLRNRQQKRLANKHARCPNENYTYTFVRVFILKW